MDHGPALDAIISDCLVNNVWSSALARLRLELPALSLCMCLIHSWLHFHYPLQNHYKIHQWVHNSWSYLWRELRLLWGTRPFVEPVECTAKQKEWYLIFKKPKEEPAQSPQRQWQAIGGLQVLGSTYGRRPLFVCKFKTWQRLKYCASPWEWSGMSTSEDQWMLDVLKINP